MTITKEQRDESEHRQLAELQVEAFITLLQKRYGLKPEAIPEILDDMRWLREHRTNLNRVSWSVLLGILAIAISGVAAALWEGIKHKLGTA
jgi:hypothetical protein